MSSHRICKVGYALNAKKLRKSELDQSTSSSRRWQGGGLADILGHKRVEIEVDGVEFQEWDSRRYLDSPFDVIIHKLTEEIEKPQLTPRLQLIDKFMHLNPSTIIIDSFEAVKNVTSRIRTCARLREVEVLCSNPKSKSGLLGQPKYIVIDSAEQDIELQMVNAGIRFPIICKPTVACGSPSSHFMVVVVSRDGLSLVQRPCLVQQYHDHDEVLYKVYVIGDDVMVYRRSSLPNLTVAGSVDPIDVEDKSIDLVNIFPGRKQGKGKKLDSLVRLHTGLNESMCIPKAVGESIGLINTGVREGMGIDAGVGEVMGRGRKFRSVAFDSRYAYPTFEDFLEPADKVGVELKPNVSCNEKSVAGDDLRPVDEIPDRSLGCAGMTKETERSHFSDVNLKSGGNHSEDRRHAHISDDAVRGGTIWVEEVVTRKRKPSSHDMDEADDGGGAASAHRFGIPMSRFRDAAESLSSHFGLSLFGFDVIVPRDVCPTHTHVQSSGSSSSIGADDVVNSSGSGGGITGNREGNVRAALSPTHRSGMRNTESASSPTTLDDAAHAVTTISVGEDGLTHDNETVGCKGEGFGLSHHSAQPSSPPPSPQPPLLVVDVNFFPSYKEVGDFPQRLRSFLRKRAGLAPWPCNSGSDPSVNLSADLSGTGEFVGLGQSGSKTQQENADSRAPQDDPHSRTHGDTNH